VAIYFDLQVLEQLPAKHEHVIKCELTEDQRRLYNESFMNCSKKFKQSSKNGHLIFLFILAFDV